VAVIGIIAEQSPLFVIDGAAEFEVDRLGQAPLVGGSGWIRSCGQGSDGSPCRCAPRDDRAAEGALRGGGVMECRGALRAPRGNGAGGSPER
jgi:hypothetical protein